MEKIKTRSDLIAHICGKFIGEIKRVTADKYNTETFLVFKTEQAAMDAFNYLVKTKLHEGICMCSLCDISKDEPAVGFEKELVRF